MIFWDEIVKRYRDKNGRFISEDSVREILFQSVEMRDDPLGTLANKLIKNEINAKFFEKELKKFIKEVYIVSYVVGRGGKEQMTSKDWGIVGRMIREQYDYLKGFVKDIQNGRYKNPNGVLARSKLYMASSTQAYEKGKANSYGLPDLPAYPGQGSECQANCKCFWKIEQLGNGDYNCYWELTSGESCPTCVNRNSTWYPLEIRGGQFRSMKTNLIGNNFIVNNNPVRSVQTFEDRTEIYFLGFPYRGTVKSETLPNGSDLHGTSFTPETDLGMIDSDRAIPVYWEHGMGELGTDILGRAYIDEETEDGRLLKVVIDRRNRYHDFLMALKEMEILRGSGHSLPYPFYEVDETTGRIRKFHVGEYTLTVTPSNDEAKPVDEEYLQKIRTIFVENNVNFDERLFMPQKRAARTAEEQVVDEKLRAAGGAANPEEEPEEEEKMMDEEMTPEQASKKKKKEKRHAEEIAELFSEEETRSVETVDNNTLYLAEQIRSLQTQLNDLAGLIEELIDGQVELARGVRNLPTRLIAEKRSFSPSEEDIVEIQRTQAKNNGRPAPRGSGFTHPYGVK